MRVGFINIHVKTFPVRCTKLYPLQSTSPARCLWKILLLPYSHRLPQLL